MSDLILQDFEAGTDGATLTPANTAGTGQTPVSGVTGTPKFTAAALEGRLSLACQNTADTAAQNATWNVTTSGTVGLMFLVKLPTPDVFSSIVNIRNSGTVLKVAVKPDNTLVLNSPAIGTVYTTPAAFTPGSTYWVGVAIDQGSSSTTGSWKFGVWNLDGSFAAGMSDVASGSGVNLGYASSVSAIYLGRVDANSDTALYVMDHVHAIDSFDIPEQPGVNTPPAADAGDDQTVEPYATCTLDGSGSSDPDGDPITYAWSQTAGTTVALSDATAQMPTFTAPASLAGATLTFSLTVNDGTQDSDPDTVTVTVPAHTWWQITNPAGPTLAPIRASLVS